MYSLPSKKTPQMVRPREEDTTIKYNNGTAILRTSKSSFKTSSTLSQNSTTVIEKIKRHQTAQFSSIKIGNFTCTSLVIPG